MLCRPLTLMETMVHDCGKKSKQVEDEKMWELWKISKWAELV